MSHDQKPGKIRVVGGSPAAPQRRRNDGAPATTAAAGATSASGVPGTPGASGAAPAGALAGATGTVAEQSSKPVMLMGLIFIAGCAIGGAALPLLGIV